MVVFICILMDRVVRCGRVNSSGVSNSVSLSLQLMLILQSMSCMDCFRIL